MRRRTYIGALATGVGLFAGCTSGDGDGQATPTPTKTTTPTDTPTPTPEPTPTATPVPDGPLIERAALVWGSGSDDWLPEKRIESAGVGATVHFGFDYVFPAERSQPAGSLQARVTDSEGSTVTSEDFSFDLDASDTDLLDNLGRISIDMDGKPAGSYTAELRMQNKYTQEKSDPAEVDFELVEPLSASEASLVASRPKTVGVGQPFRFELDFQNRSERDSSLVGQIGYREPDWNSTVGLHDVSYEIPAKSRVTHRTREMSFDEPLELIYEMPGVDVQWKIEVVEE